MNNRNIGLKITRLREAQGLTTTQLAEKVGISQAQISRLENGKQGFRSATLSKIANALGVKMSFFFQEEGENGAGLSQRLAEALGHEAFAAYAERVAAMYLEDPKVLAALSKAVPQAQVAAERA
jgi:transcriptional regulator with XRE-family HTH domain